MLFRNSRREVWRQLAAELDGKFVQGNLTVRDQIVVHHEKWTIVFDTFSKSRGNSRVPYTRIRAPYVYRDDFVFEVSRKDAIKSIGLLLGGEDIHVGDPEFDRHFVVRGNDQWKVRSFFNNSMIRQFIAYQPEITLKIREDRDHIFAQKFPKGVNEVYFEASGKIRNLDRLLDLYELFAACLDQLHHIGTADPDRPEMTF
ncbi:MAG: DUF3137 domain-containing protein [Bacteroidia bacterium]|nr:DUF3137 domain-containing protein [Bacteroidia bacterium]